MSNSAPQRPKGWNIFAVRLIDLLAQHGASLSDLDKGDKSQKIHSETVGRLKQSLASPKHFVILSKADIEKIAARFALTPQEVQELRAAILATAIEMTLFDRIADNFALQIAWNVYDMVKQAMVQASSGSEWDEIRSGEEAGTALERQAGTALELIERATVALALSAFAETRLAREEQARLALANFSVALSGLESVDVSLKATDVWQFWHEQATEGIHQAQTRLGT